MWILLKSEGCVITYYPSPDYILFLWIAKHLHIHLHLWGTTGYKNCNFSQIWKGPCGFVSRLYLSFMCFLTFCWDLTVTFSFHQREEGFFRALTKMLQLEPAKASNYPAVPSQCQHASFSPISVEGDILHAVLIKQWHAAEAAKMQLWIP